MYEKLIFLQYNKQDNLMMKMQLKVKFIRNLIKKLFNKFTEKKEIKIYRIESKTLCKVLQVICLIAID